MSLQVRAVFLEDNPADFELEMHQLKLGGIKVDAVRVQEENEYIDQLRTFAPDLIIADYALPAYDGLTALEASRRICPDVPFLFISGTAGEEIAIEAIKQGATDYLLKQNLTRLPSSVIRAISEAQKKRALDQAEHQVRDAAILYRSLVENLPLCVYRKDVEGRITFANQNMSRLFRCSPEEIIGRTMYDLLPREAAREAEIDRRVLETLEQTESGLEIEAPDGGKRFFHVMKTALLDERGQITGIQGILKDITENRQDRERIEHLNQLLRGIRSVNALMVRERDRARLLQEACELLVRTRDYRLVWIAGIEKGSNQLAPFARAGKGIDYVEGMTVTGDETPAGGGPIGASIQTHEARIVNDVSSDPTFIPWREPALERGFRSFASFPILHETKIFGVIAVYADRSGAFDPEEVELLTELAADLGFAIQSIERAEENAQLQKQFLHAQKMEVVGRLAGGIAHDFNNLLTIIIGCCNFILSDLEPNHPACRDAEQILQAGRRAADLVGNLLAFSRKQFLQPKVLDLNLLIQDASKLLRRLLGEDIKLIIQLGDKPAYIKADVTQIEQIILNLAVNARDAMPRGGILTIAAENVDLDQDFVKSHPGSRMGSCIRLSVRDTGIGMHDDVKANIFEPFFTTKEEGKGTGLGLSTVEGIVKQNEGYIGVESAPGCGSVFRIYLPRVSEVVEVSRQERGVSTKGTETILLVEDIDEIRALAVRALASEGYRVLQAQDGPTAIEIADGYTDIIHLLATDVILPNGINGKELAGRLKAVQSGLRVLYISGYPAMADGEHLLDPGGDLLAKPYSLKDLARKVREALSYSS
jgi:PAS domain S-box-containing protein